MRKRRLVLFSNHSLLAAGVQSLLQGTRGIELFMVAVDDPDASAKIKHVAPQAIVLDSGDSSLGQGVITRLLAEHPKAKVIALNLSCADINVYQMKRVFQTGPNGLLEAIWGVSAPARGKDNP